VLGITLTDTFGTPAFLEAFKKPIRPFDTSEQYGPEGLAVAAAYTESPATSPLGTNGNPTHDQGKANGKNMGSQVEPGERSKTYAEVFAGVRQDSGDPARFVCMMRQFYDSIGIKVS
jgi:nicotinate phosphoribosyltransferase